jgi:ubiquinone/menaquinone biosynthesis C-methylase UbiE
MNGADAAALKSCCAAVYASEWAQRLLGDSFHPGGLALTERLSRLLGVHPEQTVLDVASGRGTSALHLAQVFGCRVIGVEYSAESVEVARRAALAGDLADRVEFRSGDAEQLPIEDGSVDVVICECAFCTFPDKPTAAREFARVLRPGGHLGLSDVTRAGPLPPELETLFGQIACLGAAQSAERYRAYLQSAGLTTIVVEAHDEALITMLREIRGRLVGTELLAKLGQITFPAEDLVAAKRLASAAGAAVEAGHLGYTLLIASLPRSAGGRSSPTTIVT